MKALATGILPRIIPATRSGAGTMVLLLTAALLAGCAAPTPSPRYHLGQPYQASGVWHYPRESYELDETGLASVIPRGHAALTTNGELFDQGAMAGAHATIQLPAIARLTNLENGLSTMIRINDRGAGDPHRLVEVTQRTAHLLRFPAGQPVRVRLEVLGQPSHEAADTLPGAPSLGIPAIPRDAVEVAELAPPPGVAQASGRSVAMAARPTARGGDTPPPTRLAETLTQEFVRPNRLMVRLGTFGDYQYAAIQRARVAGLYPSIVRIQQGRTRLFRVEIGPFDDTARAEAAQDQALAAGVPDARIVVE